MKTTFTILNYLLLLCVSIGLNAQPTLLWQKNLGGAGNDNAYSIKPTSDGGYIVAGSSGSADGDISGNHGNLDYWVAKLDAAGNISWQKTYGGSDNDYATCIQPTRDGGYIVTGISSSGDGDATDRGQSYGRASDGTITYLGYGSEAWIVKIDMDGDIEWTRSFHSVFTSHNTVSYVPTIANSVLQLTSNQYIIAGSEYIYSEPDPPYEATIYQQLNSDGTNGTMRRSLYANGTVTAICETSNGFVICANIYNDVYEENSLGGTNILVRSLDYNGNVKWEYKYGGSNNDYVKSIIKTLDGGFALAGSSSSNDVDLAGSGSNGENDCWLLKLDSMGIVSWSKCFGGSADDVGKAVVQMADSSYLVAGTSFSTDGQVTDHTVATGDPQPDYWICKVSKTGNFDWGKSYGGTGSDELFDAAKTADGTIIIAGASASTDAGFINKGHTDYWLLKIDAGSCAVVPMPVSCNQKFCSGDHPVVSNLTARGTNIKWYSTANSSTPLSANTRLVSGTYYVSQTNTNGCESKKRAVSVTVNTTPGLPNATLFQTFCKKNNEPKVARLQADGTAIKWYRTYKSGNPLSPSAMLTTGIYYASQTVQGCESNRKIVFAIVYHCPDKKHDKEMAAVTSLYPNPAGNSVTLVLKTNAAKADLTIQVMDMNGKLMIQQTVAAVNGFVKKDIDISKLPAGIYIVKYLSDEETGYLRLQVLK